MNDKVTFEDTVALAVILLLKLCQEIPCAIFDDECLASEPRLFGGPGPAGWRRKRVGKSRDQSCISSALAGWGDAYVTILLWVTSTHSAGCAALHLRRASHPHVNEGTARGIFASAARLDYIELDARICSSTKLASPPLRSSLPASLLAFPHLPPRRSFLRSTSPPTQRTTNLRPSAAVPLVPGTWILSGPGSSIVQGNPCWRVPSLAFQAPATRGGGDPRAAARQHGV